MSELPENKSVLKKPGDNITAIHINNEINIFGKYTSIRTTQFVTYSPIDDEPKTIANEDAYWTNAVIGTLVTVALGAAAVAVLATATVLTGGVVLAALALGGAAVGTGLVTAGAAKADRESGCARDTSDFMIQMVNGAGIGAFVGATLYFVAPVLPQVSSMMSAGICAEFGISSAAFGTALGYGITGVGAMALTGSTMLSYDQIYTMGSGESVLLDKLFDGNQNAYDTATLVCDTLTMGYMDMCMQYYASNAGTSTAVVDDVEEGTGQGGKGSAKLNTSTTADADVDVNGANPNGAVAKSSGISNAATAGAAEDGVEQPKTTNSKVAGGAEDGLESQETVKPKTINASDDGADVSGMGVSGKKSGLYMEEGESGTKTVNGYDAKVNEGQQNKHIPGTNEYKNALNNGQTKSILYGDTNDIQSLLNQKAGTGDFLGTNKERVNFGKVIGQYIDPETGIGVETTMGIIHYGKKGAHIVPARPN